MDTNVVLLLFVLLLFLSLFKIPKLCQYILVDGNLLDFA